jgi:hypothetical protein
MTKTLAGAYEQALARRRGGESTDRATITIEPIEAVGKRSDFVGIAIVDECWHSDIYSGRSTEFRVESGAHLVTVHLGRRYRIAGYLGRAKASLPVVVEPGEQLDLVYGISPDWQPPPRPRFFWPPFLWLAGSALAFGIGWNVSPLLPAVVGSTIGALGMQQPWRSVFGFLVSTRIATAVAAMYAWLIVGTIFLMKFARRLNSPMASVDSPYILMRRCDLGQPLARFKKPYVDPFE